MKQGCGHCGEETLIHKFGKFYRKDDAKYIQRYRCQRCKKSFSRATFHPAFRQKKRRINPTLAVFLASNMSMRRAAKLLHVAYSTVDRRARYLAAQCRANLTAYYATLPAVPALQFDELQTIEHSKCKPLSVALAVNAKTRVILGFAVSRMPATGHLATISRKKYGFRPDQRQEGLGQLFRQIRPLLSDKVCILSDLCPFYSKLVRHYFPNAQYKQVHGEKSCVAGQGELKKTGHDPLFCINHTLAMCRANINRLIRKTWCTTKDPTRLADHLAIYTWVHNKRLLAANP